VFPWALVYEIPLETGIDPDEYHVCPFVAYWYASESGHDELHRCPQEHTHTDNTVCPFGFWGIKHVLEQPPSMREAPSEIKISRRPARMIAALSEDLDGPVAREHFGRIAKNLGGQFTVTSHRSRDDFRQALNREPMLELLYFYCHGRHMDDGKTSPPSTYLELGDGERLTPTDISAWTTKWKEEHWRDTPPLVFINGCHTTDLTPESLVSFVKAFAGAHAAGIIGTETAVHETVATEVAERFLSYVRPDVSSDARSVGESLRRVRLDLLRKGNVMGLTYTAYCSASLRFSIA
jgi:hypothetical protein